MNTLDKLMKFNPASIVLPTKTVKRKLRKLDGMEVEFELRALTNEEAANLQAESFDGKMNGNVKLNLYAPSVKKILIGCPIFKDKDLQSHFKCNTAKELIETILNKSDMDFLTKEIDTLTGFDDETEEELKDDVLNL